MEYTDFTCRQVDTLPGRPLAEAQTDSGGMGGH